MIINFLHSINVIMAVCMTLRDLFLQYPPWNSCVRQSSSERRLTLEVYQYTYRRKCEYIAVMMVPLIGTSMLLKYFRTAWLVRKLNTQKYYSNTVQTYLYTNTNVFINAERQYTI